MSTSLYREIIPKLKDLMGFCRIMGIPVFYTEAVKEDSVYYQHYYVAQTNNNKVSQRLKYDLVVGLHPVKFRIT
jgi:hypothetical protein